MKIYLAPGLLKNIEKSVIFGVKIDELNIKDPLLRETISKRFGTNPIKLWALKETCRNSWASIEPGDYLLFYNRKKFIYIGKVSFKYPFHDTPDQVAVGSYLAESVWGKDIDGRTWPYLIFLEDTMKINLSLNEFNRLTGYRSYAIRGFRKTQEDKVKKLLEYLQNYIKPFSSSSALTSEAQQNLSVDIGFREEKIQYNLITEDTITEDHERVVDYIYKLGELIGYRPEKKFRHEGYELDVVWYKPPKVGPKYVFEVHVKGNLEAALLRLKHAYERWESMLFFVSTEDQIEKAKQRLNDLHELGEHITFVKIKDIIEFYNFKTRFEELERKFGLRPKILSSP